MRPAMSVRRLSLLLLGVLVGVVAITTGVNAAQSSPSFAIAISPSSQSVQRGQTASYTVTVTSQNGFSSPVTLTASGGPAGSSLGSSTLTPAAGAAASTTLTARTSSTSATGSYTLTVSGTSGKLKGSATAGLTVTAVVSGSFSLALTPSTLSVVAGSSGSYTVTLTRTAFAGPVSLALYGKLPPGVTSATFSPQTLSDTAASSTLTVTTDPTADSATVTVYVVGSSGSQLAYTQGALVIAKSQGKPFTISSPPLTGLAPGVSKPLDLVLTNTNQQAISITNLTVSLTSTSLSSCSTGNFSVVQYTGSYPIQVPGGSTVSLSALAKPSSSWPLLTMRNTSTNQDGCKSTSLALSYSGSATGS